MYQFPGNIAFSDFCVDEVVILGDINNNQLHKCNHVKMFLIQYLTQITSTTLATLLIKQTKKIIKALYPTQSIQLLKRH